MEKIIPLLIMGCGGVGRQLIQHIVNTRPLHYSQGIRLRVLGVCDSQSLLMATNVPAAELSDECLKKICHLKSSGFPLSAMDSVDGFQVFGVHEVNIKLLDIASSLGRSTVLLLVGLRMMEGPQGEEEKLKKCLVFIDCSASDGTSQLLNKVLELGCCVVLANKKPLTSNIEVYEKMISNPRHLRCESTVGAGLPVITSLNRLKASGDPVRRIMGALSGTLGYVMSELQGGQSFSEVVRAAKALGFTEPDPRDDLSGMDVARKALILARLLGWRISLENVEVESLYPCEMGPEAMSVEDFLSKGLPTLDKAMEERIKTAGLNGNVVRYVCTIEDLRCKVGLLEVPESSPLGQLKGSDNLVEIYSRCYKKLPLVIRGAGAGNDTTASGVLADIVDLQDLFCSLN